MAGAQSARERGVGDAVRGGHGLDLTGHDEEPGLLSMGRHHTAASRECLELMYGQ